MISDETRKKLRENAIKHKLGGNTGLQRLYSDQEITDLFQAYKHHDCGNTFKSLFSDKTYDSLVKWKNDVGRHLDKKSRKKLYYFIHQYHEGEQKCGIRDCNKILDFFSYTDLYQMANYCPECMATHAWKTKKNLNADLLEIRKRRISEVKLKFYQTQEGRKVASIIGSKNSYRMKAFHQTDAGKLAAEKSRKRNSSLMKEKILSGKFTPNSNNKNTHWESCFRGMKFRSSWEAIYKYWNPYAEYEMVRIPYAYGIYIVDFVDTKNKELIEIKPASGLSNLKFIAKKEAAEKWSQEKGYSYKIITEVELLALGKPLDLQDFDQNTQRKIEKFYEKTKN